MRLRGFVVVRLVSVLFFMSVLSPSAVYALRDKKTLVPTADSSVWSDAPDKNWGWGWELDLERLPYRERLVFLMFDLAEIPSSATIEKAELWLYAVGVFMQGLASAYYCPNNDWTEEGITYNNKPSFSDDPLDTANLTNSTISYKWNVTVATQLAFRVSERKLTLVLRVDNLGSADFYSIHDPTAKPPLPDRRPQLVVLYDAPPPSNNNSVLTSLIIITVTVTAIVGLESAYILRKRRRKQPTL